MTKSEAAHIFGGAYADLARALEISRAGISQWPMELSLAQTDRVIGAARRLGKRVPMRFLPRKVREVELEAEAQEA